MKRIYLISVLTTSLFCCLEPVSACGPSISLDEARFSLFRNGLNGYDGLAAFYYTESLMNGDTPDPQGLDYQKNCEEWKAFTGDAGINVLDIFAIQYKTAPVVFLTAYQNNDWSGFKKNTFIQWLIKDKNKKALQYFAFAKQAEATQFARDTDDWSYPTAEQKKANLSIIDSLTNTAIGLGKKSKSFLQTRYYFQAIKMGYYAGYNSKDKTGEKLISLFEKQIEPQTNTVVTGWAYHFCGLMLPEKSYKRVIFQLKSFDLSEEKKLAAYKDLNLNYTNDFVLSNKDKSVEEAFLVYRGYFQSGRELPTIEKLYNLNPNSKYLPLLITREVNKIENWKWSYEQLKFNNINSEFKSPYSYNEQTKAYVEDNKQKDWSYFNKVVAFLERIVGNADGQQALNTLALTHLYNIKGDFSKAKQLADNYKFDEKSKYYQQYLIERIIYTSQLEDVLYDTVKSKIYKDLQVFSAQKEAYIKQHFSNEEYYTVGNEEMDDVDELLVYLSNVYKQKGDILTAGLLMHKTEALVNEYGYKYSYCCAYSDNPTMKNANNNYSSIAYFDKFAEVDDVYNLIMFKYKKNKTSFEQFISPKGWADDDMYYDLIGTKYMREENYDKALSVFEKIRNDFWETEYEYRNHLPVTNIFHFGSYAPWDTKNYGTYTTFSKKEIVKDIVQVTTQLNNSKLTADQRAELLWKLGNAKLNMTYNGLFWMMLSYGKSYRESIDDGDNLFYYTFYPNSEVYGNTYYKGATAKLAYDAAYKLVTNKELKAKIFFSKDLWSVLCNDDKGKQKTIDADIKQTLAYEHTMTYCPDAIDGRL